MVTMPRLTYQLCANALTASLALATLFSIAQTTNGEDREWVDKTGLVTIEGQLMGYDQQRVIIETKEKELVSLEIEHLSDDDKKFLESKEAEEHLQKMASEKQIWELANGLKVTGQVMDFVDRDLTIQRKGGFIYANDRRFDNLPPVYQKMVPKVINHFENTELEDLDDVKSWLLKLKGKPANYHIEGVTLQLDNGDLYAVPFFFFQPSDQEVLREGFKRWQEATTKEDDDSKQQESAQLESMARAYQMDQARDRAEQRRVTNMQLALLGAASGVTDIWEVELIPRGPYPWTTTAVSARSSDQAMVIAARENPGYAIGGVRKLNRNGRGWRW